MLWDWLGGNEAAINSTNLTREIAASLRRALIRAMVAGALVVVVGVGAVALLVRWARG